MGSRNPYVITGVTDARHVCAIVFDVLDGCVQAVVIDAYSDYDAQMPDDIRRAQAWLRERGLQRSDGDPGESISITRSDDIGWEISRAYALWATHVRLLDQAGSQVASLDDGGHAITAELTDRELAMLVERLGDTATVSALTSPS